MNSVQSNFDPKELGLDVRGYSGYEALCLCPYHDDHEPSASFNILTGLFFCFACGMASTAKDIAKLLDGVITQGTVTISKQMNNTEWRKLLSFPIASGNEYLHRRKVTEDQISSHRIRSMPNGIIFEIPNYRGHTVGICVRRMVGKPKYLYFGEKTAVWPLPKLRATRPGSAIFLVEGVFGVLRAELANVAAFATLGAMVKPAVRDILSSFHPIVLFDRDFAGYAGGGRVLQFCPNAKVVIPGMEADELLVREWESIAQSQYTTRSLRYLATLSGDPQKFYQFLPRLIKRRR